MSKYDQPGDESYRDPIASSRMRPCDRCGRKTFDDSSTHTMRIVCDACYLVLRERRDEEARPR